MKYNISYYKSSNKKMPTNKELTDIVYKINDNIFQITNGYTIKGKTKRVGIALSKICIELGELKVNKKYDRKKAEIAQYLNDTLQNLRVAYKQSNNMQELQTTLNYNLSLAIKFKNEQHDAHEILAKIQSLIQLKKDLCEDYTTLNTIQFEKILSELKEKLIFLLN